MSFLSGNLTAILLKTKKSSDSLSQQNAKENNSQTAFVIEVRLDIKKIIEKPSAAIILQKTTSILLHMLLHVTTYYYTWTKKRGFT